MLMGAPLRMPCGIKNMFATLCSKPRVANMETGTQMPRSLPPVLWEAIAIQTAASRRGQAELSSQRMLLHRLGFVGPFNVDDFRRPG